MSTFPHTLRARWIIPVHGSPIENGAIEISASGRIDAVRPARANEPATDLADCVVIPGLVNAHTHLELTDLKGKVPFTGSFTGWIRALMPQLPRRVSREAQNQAMHHGLEQSLAGGVTALADIGGGGEAMQVWSTAAAKILGFLEVIGSGPRREGAVRQAIDAIGDVPPGSSDAARVGITPHAPYTTDAPVYREVLAYCGRTGRAVCTHLAETREEEQFLREGSGPFRELLEAFGLWDGSFEIPRCSPVEHARRLGLLDAAALLAHVNYVSEDDLAILASSQASVAYCPRTHAFFRHEPHRYRDMIARGINVCIGTDSLASNESLSMLDELRFLRRLDRDSSDARLLEMGTRNGARAMRLGALAGTIAAGAPADLLAIPLDHVETREPLADVLHGEAAATRMWVDGRCVAGTP